MIRCLYLLIPGPPHLLYVVIINVKPVKPPIIVFRTAQCRSKDPDAATNFVNPMKMHKTAPRIARVRAEKSAAIMYVPITKPWLPVRQTAPPNAATKHVKIHAAKT